MALATVAQYVAMARRMLQDEVETYRYDDGAYIDGLNVGLLEMRRLRPDLFSADFTTAVPSFSTNDSTAVSVDEQYRMTLLYYVCGHVQLTDDEATQDGRANYFLNKFTAQLMSSAA